MNNWLRLLSASAIAAFCVSSMSHRILADPCGMVPPLYIQGDVPLERIGLQKTYVFFRDGVETFVIRPGFQGKVEEFGMLIPFPNPPALRKIPDDTFAHIAAAVDPPEVVVDLTPMPFDSYAEADVSMAFGASGAEEESLSVSEVRIVKQEAVGMYEVAVLEAGSANALDKWMTDHGYRYPTGMDDVCNDYVKDGWCFVAVKARVGQKDGVDPKPGMKQANAGLPDGASFDGHVQGMGFRFRSDELVVPMRLSAFNEGDLHNVVYLLTDSPMKARDLPAGHVVRQISGEELLRNVTGPLPLRIIGGDFEDIPKERLPRLEMDRDPMPHNGIAKILFAGDLEASRTKKLTHHHEELEKALLNIGERLNLRGPEIDALHHAALEAEQQEIASAAIQELSNMSMTVIDGDFEREVVAADNVYFTRFEMNPARNTPRRYNARMFGPSDEGVGLLMDDFAETESSSVAILDPQHGKLILQDSENRKTSRKWLIVAGVLITGAFLCVMFIRGGRKTAALLIFAICAVGSAQDTDSQTVVSGLLDELQDGSDRDAAYSRASSLSSDSVNELLTVARSSDEIDRRGWAVVCLASMSGDDASQALDLLKSDQSQPPLVRTWAAAALVNSTAEIDSLVASAQLCQQLPALRRPLRLRILDLLQSSEAEFSVESLLRLTISDYELQQALAPVLLKVEPGRLAATLLKSDNQELRRQAAAWLATQKQHQNANVEQAVIKSLVFSSEEKSVPWKSGPLYVPALNWNKEQAISLISELTAWYVWCSANEQSAELSKIHTNLYSRQLMSAAGFEQVPTDVKEWLNVWKNVIGDEAMEELMSRTGYRFTPAKFEKIEQ